MFLFCAELESKLKKKPISLLRKSIYPNITNDSLSNQTNQVLPLFLWLIIWIWTWSSLLKIKEPSTRITPSNFNDSHFRSPPLLWGSLLLGVGSSSINTLIIPWRSPLDLMSLDAMTHREILWWLKTTALTGEPHEALIHLFTFSTKRKKVPKKEKGLLLFFQPLKPRGDRSCANTRLWHLRLHFDPLLVGDTYQFLKNVGTQIWGDNPWRLELPPWSHTITYPTILDIKSQWPVKMQET